MIVVTGSLAFDYILNFPGLFSDQILPEKLHQINISFTTDKLKREFGGTAGNQAYNLALLGIDTTILAAAGSDFSDYKKHLIKSKVGTKYIKIIKNKLTASGFVLTDSADNQIWGFAKSAMISAGKLSLNSIKEPIDFVAITPNDIAAMTKLVDECTEKNTPYLFDPAFYITTFKPAELKRGIKNAKIIIGNDYEIAMMRKIVKPKYDKDQIVITTLGADGSIIEKDQKTIVIRPAKPQNTSDPTGAGDAFRSGFLAGFIRGFDLLTCGQMGSTAAVYTVEKYGTQTHKFTKKEFEARYKKNFKKDLKL